MKPYLLITALLATTAWQLAADEPQPPATPQQPALTNPTRERGTAKQPADEAQIRRWFEQLDSDQATERDAALHALKAQGPTVIEPALQAALSDRLEVSIRAVQILEALDDSSDEASYAPADKALRRVVADGRTGAARRAQEALDRHSGKRMVRVVRAIRALKGQVGKLDNPQFREVADPNWLPPLGLIDKQWKGTDDDLELFTHIDSIRGLYLLKGHSVSEQRLKKFAMDHPEISLIERGAAFLGVATGNGFIGCEIGSVVPDKAADLAGIQARDMVVQIGDYAVHTSEDLIRAVGEYEPNDEVKIVLLRDDQFVYRRWFFMWFNEQEDFPKLFPLLILQSMRQEVSVKLDRWSLTEWKETSERTRPARGELE